MAYHLVGNASHQRVPDHEMTDLRPDTSTYAGPRVSATSGHLSISSEAPLWPEDGAYDLRRRSSNRFQSLGESPHSGPWAKFTNALTRSGAAPARYATVRRRRRDTPRYSGWRMGVLVSCVCVGVCLAVEMASVAAAVGFDYPEGGLGLLLEGSCDRVKSYSLIILVPFNIIGTVLIGCTNYVMQCVNAPTRKELDVAHASGSALSIGVSSFHNLKHVSWKKQVAWWVLGISTIPIHLLLNSVVFVSLQSNNYAIIVASQDFQEDRSWDVCTNVTSPTALSICSIRYESIQNPQAFQNLTPSECMNQYSNAIQGSVTNVFLITSKPNGTWSGVDYSTGILGQGNFTNGNTDVGNATGQDPQYALSADSLLWNVSSFRAASSAFDYRRVVIAEELDYDPRQPLMRLAKQWEPNSWLCNPQWLLEGRECTLSLALLNATDWHVTPRAFPIDYCLSEKAEEYCTLQYSLDILIALVVCDVVKLFVMACALVDGTRDHADADTNVLMTLGDSIHSFLHRPDPSSVGRCLITQKQVRADRKELKYSKARQQAIGKYDHLATPDHILEKADVLGPRPQPWVPGNERWRSVPSRSRWILFALIYTALFAATTVIFSICIGNLQQVDVTGLWNQGIGSINPNAVFTSTFFDSVGAPSRLLQAVVVINIPQILFSFLYFVYNGLFTCMHAGAEWSRFARKRKTLRVSEPRGKQRSTYWLSLPWRYSLPLVLTSGTLHWLVSRSLFLVKIDVYGPDGDPQPDLNVSACGFSPLAILLVMVLLIVMLGIVGLFAGRTLDATSPVVGTCSWAVSAGCHDLGGAREAELEPLMWGVVDWGDEERPGHCTITSRPVERPVRGQMYQ